MKILVVEDNPVTGTLMVGILTNSGHATRLAQSVSEALHLLSSEPDIEGVITDVMMPDVSGLDLLRTLRESPKWRDLPAIVTTVRDDRETVMQAAALGCKQYILKPINPAKLLEKVAQCFKQERVVLMNPGEVTSRFGLSPEVYPKIAKTFALQVDRAMAALENRRANPSVNSSIDFTQITEGATLLGAERLAAKLAEVSAETYGNWSCSPLVASLLHELQLVQEALRNLSV